GHHQRMERLWFGVQAETQLAAVGDSSGGARAPEHGRSQKCAPVGGPARRAQGQVPRRQITHRAITSPGLVAYRHADITTINTKGAHASAGGAKPLSSGRSRFPQEGSGSETLRPNRPRLASART